MKNKKLIVTSITLLLICLLMLGGCDLSNNENNNKQINIKYCSIIDEQFSLDGEINVKLNENFSLQFIPMKEGYVFDGLYDDEECLGTKIVDENGNSIEPIVKGGDRILFAKWLPCDKYVHLSIDNDIKLEKNYINLQFGLDTLPSNPKKEGWEFDGWYTKEVGGVRVGDSFGYEENFNDVDANGWKQLEKDSNGKYCLYARFNKIKPIVKFHFKEDRVERVELDGKANLQEALNKIKYKPEYTVISWKDKDGKSFDGYITNDIDLYTDKIGVDIQLGNKKMFLPVGVTIPLPDCKEDGKFFEGWKNESGEIFKGKLEVPDKNTKYIPSNVTDVPLELSIEGCIYNVNIPYNMNIADLKKDEIKNKMKEGITDDRIFKIIEQTDYWLLNPLNDTPENFFVGNIIEKITLYPSNVKSVIINVYDGDKVVDRYNIPEGSSIKLKDMATEKTRFYGYFTKDSQQYLPNVEYKFDTSLDLYLKYDLIKIDITFVIGGQSVTSRYDTAEIDVSTITKFRNGIEINKWATSPNQKQAITGKITKDITLYPCVRTISFNVDKAPITGEIGEEIKIKPVYMPNKLFVAWEENNQAINNGIYYIKDKDVVLTAKTTSNQKTLAHTYEGNNGKGVLIGVGCDKYYDYYNVKEQLGMSVSEMRKNGYSFAEFTIDLYLAESNDCYQDIYINNLNYIDSSLYVDDVRKNKTNPIPLEHTPGKTDTSFRWHTIKFNAYLSNVSETFSVKYSTHRGWGWDDYYLRNVKITMKVVK